jgi:glycosyltransferase involved in cell wall biosynthesis
MKNFPTITVVTLTRNNPEELFLTLYSIEKSIPNFKGLQVFVVDGSDVKSQLGTEEFSKIEITYLWLETGGIFNAMNYAIKFLTTDYVMFLNAGDVFRDDFNFSILINELEQYNPIWLVGRASMTRKDGSVEVWRVPKNSDFRLRFAINSYPHQATVYRSDVLRNNLGFDESSEVADWKLSLHLLKIGRPYLSNNFISHNALPGASSRINFFSRILQVTEGRRSADSQFGNIKFFDYFLQLIIEILIKFKKILRGV